VNNQLELSADLKIAARNALLFVVGAAASAFMLTALAGCKNAYDEFAQKTTDPALMFEAQQLMDAGDFTGAIAAINKMSTDGKANDDAKTLLGSAYAGRCGLDLISLADKISKMSTATLFETLLAAYKGAVAAQVADCKLAESTLLSLSTPGADQKVLLAFVEFAKIGTILAAYGDSDGNGTVGPGFDPCTHGGSPPLSDANAGHVGTGITIAAASLAGTSIGSSTMDTIASLCTTIDSLLAVSSPGYSGFCNKKDSTAWTANELLGIRSVINANEIGLKTCAAGTPTIGNCVCP
jgi:hypothetical protein